jgi:hypothetical protein
MLRHQPLGGADTRRDDKAAKETLVAFYLLLGIKIIVVLNELFMTSLNLVLLSGSAAQERL